jgi:hypothetical protein
VRGVVPIRLSPAEKRRLAMAAVLRDLPLSTYVRIAALEQAERDLALERERQPGSAISRAATVSRAANVSREKLASGHAAGDSEHHPPSPAWWELEQLGYSVGGRTWDEYAAGRDGGLFAPGGSPREVPDDG